MICYPFLIYTTGCLSCSTRLPPPPQALSSFTFLSLRIASVSLAPPSNFCLSTYPSSLGSSTPTSGTLSYDSRSVLINTTDAPHDTEPSMASVYTRGNETLCLYLKDPHAIQQSQVQDFNWILVFPFPSFVSCFHFIYLQASISDLTSHSSPKS